MHGLKSEKAAVLHNGKRQLFIIKVIKYYKTVINIKQHIKIKIKIQKKQKLGYY